MDDPLYESQRNLQIKPITLLLLTWSYLEAGVGASDLAIGLVTGETILVSLRIGVLFIFFVNEVIGVLTVAPLK